MNLTLCVIKLDLHLFQDLARRTEQISTAQVDRPGGDG